MLFNDYYSINLFQGVTVSALVHFPMSSIRLLIELDRIQVFTTGPGSGYKRGAQLPQQGTGAH